MKCKECKGTGTVYGAACGFCRATGEERGLSEAQYRKQSHYTCSCGSRELGLTTHGMDCPFSPEVREIFRKAK